MNILRFRGREFRSAARLGIRFFFAGDGKGEKVGLKAVCVYAWFGWDGGKVG